MDLKLSYHELYGYNEITEYRWNQLTDIMEKAKKNRPAALKRADRAGNACTFFAYFKIQRSQ